MANSADLALTRSQTGSSGKGLLEDPNGLKEKFLESVAVRSWEDQLPAQGWALHLEGEVVLRMRRDGGERVFG